MHDPYGHQNYGQQPQGGYTPPPANPYPVPYYPPNKYVPVRQYGDPPPHGQTHTYVPPALPPMHAQQPYGYYHVVQHAPAYTQPKRVKRAKYPHREPYRKSVTKTRKKTSHTFHLIASGWSGGLWALVGWLPMLLWNNLGPRKKTVTKYRR